MGIETLYICDNCGWKNYLYNNERHWVEVKRFGGQMSFRDSSKLYCSNCICAVEIEEGPND